MPPPDHDVNASSVTSIALTWPQPEMYGGAPVGYEVFRDDGAGTIFQTRPAASCRAASSQCNNASTFCMLPAYEVPDAPGCIISGLRKDTTYRIRIRALNEFGAGT